jgi:hypothetical protein
MALYVAATGDDGSERRDGVLTGVGNFGGGDLGVGGVSLDTDCDFARRGGIASSNWKLGEHNPERGRGD